MASSRDKIGVGAISVSMTSTGNSTWRKLDGVFSVFAWQPVVSSGCTGLSVSMQGTLSTNSTTPLTICDSVTARTGAVVKSTSATPITQIRFHSTELSSGTLTNYVCAIPS